MAVVILFWILSGVLQGFSYISGKSEELKWMCLASFSTHFNQNEAGRCEDIVLASGFIDKATIQPYGEFSFNQTVGKRTVGAGFKSAKVIQDGEYKTGVGGGVCQVSTTLYNAVLLSGLTVTEFHPHSLAVGYIEPSRDAMVSSQSDLSFYNPYSFPVRLRMQIKSGTLTVYVYGLNAPLQLSKYKLVSRVTEEILPPCAEIRYGKKEEILRKEKSGVKSEAYLERYEKGVLVSRKRIRKDYYLPIQGIIVKKMQNSGEKLS
jgi:vancomycin resistance protein YoaR